MCSITAIIVLRRFLIMFYDSPNENNEDEDIQTLKETVFDLIRGIRDPEKIETLEELKVVQEDDVKVERFSEYCYLIKIEFIPTVPHCSLASLIGLCLRKKLDRDLPENFKLDVFIKEGTHETAEDINRQINDKERIAAALENQNLRELVDKCVAYEAL